MDRGACGITAAWPGCPPRGLPLQSGIARRRGGARRVLLL